MPRERNAPKDCPAEPVNLIVIVSCGNPLTPYVFATRLDSTVPAVRLILRIGNATETFSIHQKTGLGKVGFIICCLPFVSLPNEIGEQILLEIDKFMQKGCLLRTFQYAHGYYMPSAIKLREFMRNRYGKVKRSQLIVKNVPPAYTLTWQT